MKSSGKTRISVPGRSEGDGMENVSPSEGTGTKRWSGGTYMVLSHGGKQREPKFVPYEPYKAAVSPLVPTSREQRAVAQCLADTQRVSSLAESVMQRYMEPDAQKVAALEEKIALLEKEKKEIMSQYHVQTEVNGDLKKMLVAALGEDVMLKVQFMTEDKALLGKELLRLNEDLDQAKEEADRLAIHSDVWESKFKASSLMVKDLAHWKASLSRRLRESFRIMGTVLEEHDLLFEKLCATHRILENTLAAFDSPVAETTSSRSVRSSDLTELASELNKMSRSIRERLLGRLYCSNVCDAGFEYARRYTRAENLLQQTLKSFEQNGALHHTELSKDPCPAAPPTAPSISFCKHCCGEVQLL